MTLSLLIVDDSELICSSLIGLLEHIPGIERIHTANTLAQAFDSVQRLAPALLILDIHLPDGNAIGQIKPLKQLAPGMRVAMLTNDVNDFNRTKCLAAGADCFFDKSTEFDDLLELLRKEAMRN